MDKSLGAEQFLFLFDVWRVGDTHLNNTPYTDLPTRTALATLLGKPRSTSRGSGDHFWAVAIPIAACSDRFNSLSTR